MNQLFIDKNKCCGCSSCYNACPTQAISMIPDEEGFLYPVVDEKKCCNCKKCETVCFYKQKKAANYEIKKFYALKYDDLRVLKESQSGGAFTAISNFVLKKDGIIYGAAFDNNFHVKHIRCTSENERNMLRGSKYVQSEIGEIFKKVKEDLTNDKYVLFTGTGCQIAGLWYYLPEHLKEKLFLVDIICYGVPSPGLWDSFVKIKQKKYRDKISQIKFRDKAYGWQSCKQTFYINNKRNVINGYINLFHSDEILRPSCYSCYSAGETRFSDLTIGDCWGIEKNNPEFYDKNGVSLVICNTQKGENLLSEIENVNLLELDPKLYMQDRLVSPTKCPIDRDRFWEIIKRKSLNHVINYINLKTNLNDVRFYTISFLGKIKNNIKKLFK